jgi:hypothetical protein
MATVSFMSLLMAFQKALGLRTGPSDPSPNGATDDPFHDPLMLAIGVVLLLTAFAIVIATGVIHWGVEYGQPAWNSHSFPPPISY